ncbi:MAG: flagellar basal body P-ring formation chaperone FlgA [Halioglobus sp.]
MDKHPRFLSIIWRSRLLWGLLAALPWANTAAGAGEALQPLETINAAAVAASEERARQQGYDNVAVDVRPLDHRLRLPQCAQPLTSFIPPASQILGAVSVGIECAGPKPWTIYVRTQVSAQRAVPVLARAVPRNTVISAADIQLINQPLESTGEGIVFDPDQIIGMELTRSLDEGSTVRVKYLRPPKIIKRGQQVTLVSGVGGLEVRMQGKALGDAAEGERVSVATTGSGKTVEGIAHSDGSVYVP